MIGERIKISRKHAGLTQNQLERKAKICETAISRIENGRTDMKLSTLVTIIKILKADSNFILGIKYEPRS